MTEQFEITVQRSALLHELTAAQGVVERKTTIPILSNFLFEAEGDRLTVTATNLDQSIRTSCEAKVKKPGCCTVPALKLYDLVKLLPEGEISFKQLDNYWVQIRAGRSHSKMVGMARANFPQVQDLPAADAIRIPAQLLAQLVAKTIYAVSEEESRYTLNGALLLVKPESLTMVATDGHRLAHVERFTETLGVSGERRTMIPMSALGDLRALLNDCSAEDTVLFAQTEETLFFAVAGRTLTSRKLTGQFPNYEAVLPRDNNKFVIVRSEDLMGALQRVTKFSDGCNGAIKMSLASNELRLASSSPDLGESEDVIETPYIYEPLKFGFQSRYVSEFIKSIAGVGEVRMTFKDGQSAAELRPEDGRDDQRHRYLLMPMRI